MKLFGTIRSVVNVQTHTGEIAKVFLSREADLNHRPKDHCLNIQLQSSALPAELSRVDRYDGDKTCISFRIEYNSNLHVFSNP